MNKFAFIQGNIAWLFLAEAKQPFGVLSGDADSDIES